PDCCIAASGTGSSARRGIIAAMPHTAPRRAPFRRSRVTRAFAPFAALLLVVCSCARREAPGPKADFSVALLTPGPISDAGWNAGAYDGLKAIEKELGAKI